MIAAFRSWRGALLMALAAAILGCATTAGAPVATSVDGHPEAAFLPDPLHGYPRSMNAAVAEELRTAHERLIAERDSASARARAEALLDRYPELEPAEILLGQADFADGLFESALARAAPIADRYPDYVAAQLLVGRAAQRLERVPEAFAAYLSIAARSDAAGREADRLRSRAVEIAGNRAQDLLTRGRLEEAGRAVEQLEAWAPNDARTLELAARYAADSADPGAELAAVRRLIEFGGSRDLLRRRALLELEVGDAGEGLRLLEMLVEQDPGDAQLAADLDRAKFRWRVNLLPDDVVELLGRSELSRADHARLLFWLFPVVRYGRPTEGRIASDILDHPHRQEIARVVNLGLMRMDSTLHLFHPERIMDRRDALESVLRILGGRMPRPACLGNLDPGASLSVETLCRMSAGCGLLAEAGDCLPEAAASGRFVERVCFAALEISGGA